MEETLIAEWGLPGLFLAGLLAATLLPGGSEFAVAGMALYSGHPAWAIVAAAATGNTLGGLTSVFLGRLARRRWPPERAAARRHARAVGWLERHGSPALVFSWAPVVGDPLCVAAGWLGIGWGRATAWIAAGKTFRYVVVVWLVA